MTPGDCSPRSSWCGPADTSAARRCRSSSGCLIPASAWRRAPRVSARTKTSAPRNAPRCARVTARRGSKRRSARWCRRRNCRPSRRSPTAQPIRLRRRRLRRLRSSAMASTRVFRRVRRNNARPKTSSPLATCQKGEPLEQVHILLVLDERAMQRRNELFRIALAQRLGADILDQQELEPVEKLRGRRLLLHPRNLADLVEQLERLGYQALLDAGKMHLHDRAHGLRVGEADVVEETAA